jgi:hypothetical protein
MIINEDASTKRVSIQNSNAIEVTNQTRNAADAR